MVRSLALVVAVLGMQARAQGADVEFFGGLTFWFPSLDTTYDASYTPSRVVGIRQLFETPDPRSRAHQEIALEGGRSLGWGFGMNVYPHPVVGFQFLFDRARVDVTGENPAHQVELTYDTIAFPSPDPIVATTRFTFDAPDTDASLDETSLSFNGTARFGRSRAVSGSVSGGVSYYRFRFSGGRIGAHAAWLGGHAVLFSELYEATFETSATDAFGFNLGGQLDVSLGSKVALFVDGRLFHAPATRAEVSLDELVSTNINSVPLSQIESFLDLPPVELDPGYIRVLFGLKWRP